MMRSLGDITYQSTYLGTDATILCLLKTLTCTISSIKDGVLKPITPVRMVAVNVSFVTLTRWQENQRHPHSPFDKMEFTAVFLCHNTSYWCSIKCLMKWCGGGRGQTG